MDLLVKLVSFLDVGVYVSVGFADFFSQVFNLLIDGGEVMRFFLYDGQVCSSALVLGYRMGST